MHKKIKDKIENQDLVKPHNLTLHKLPTSYDPPIESLTKHIEIGADGITPVIPVDVVDQILVENEQIRFELSDASHDGVHYLYDELAQHNSASTSQLKRRINTLHKNIKGVIPKPALWQFFFDIVLNYDNIADCEHNETMLHLTWRIGKLPLLAIHISAFENVINFMGRYGEFDLTLAKIAQSFTKKIALKNNKLTKKS